MKRVFTAVTIVLLVVGLAPYAQAGHENHRSYDITLAGVELRPGVAADLQVKVYVNTGHPCASNTILGIHGMAQTAATWEPFVNELFADNPAGRKVCRFVAINLPGHGGSGLPTGGPAFGDLAIQDYVAATLGAMDRLDDFGLRPHTLIGHSLGGLVVQMTQQALADRGTTLRRAYGVKNVVLLASALPGSLPWPSFDSNPLVGMLAGFGTWSPDLGVYLDIPYEPTSVPGFPEPVLPWQMMLFMTRSYALVPGTPMPSDVAAKGYHAFVPGTVAWQMQHRPLVEAGIFGRDRGTSLSLVTYEQDPLLTLPEVQELYAYLTGDGGATGVAFVMGSYAVHNTHMSDPALLLWSVACAVRLP
jgi:pimeloyl-ACP methyl ester carboxylesterase